MKNNQKIEAAIKNQTYHDPKARADLRALLVEQGNLLDAEMDKITKVAEGLKNKNVDPATRANMQALIDEQSGVIEAESQRLLRIMRAIGDVEVGEPARVQPAN